MREGATGRSNQEGKSPQSGLRSQEYQMAVGAYILDAPRSTELNGMICLVATMFLLKEGGGGDREEGEGGGSGGEGVEKEEEEEGKGGGGEREGEKEEEEEEKEEEEK